MLLIFLGIPLILGLIVQSRLKSTFAKNSRVPVASGKTGAEVARGEPRS